MKFVGRMGKRTYILSKQIRRWKSNTTVTVVWKDEKRWKHPDRLIMWNICEYLPPNLHIHTCIPYEQKRGDGTHQHS